MVPEIHPPVPSHQYPPTSSFSTSKLPPEILTIIFRFLSFADLKNALRVCKWWREVAEQPALWTNLDLVHRIGESPEYGLVEVLTMARQRSLQRLTLNFRFMDKIFWEDCVHFLQVVADLCPSVKSLSWDKGGKIAMIPRRLTAITHVDKRAQNLVAQMVKFEEVHFFSPFVGEQQLAVNGINDAILRAASEVEDSKLKVLTMVGDQPIDPAVLAVAQKKLTINMSEDSLERSLYTQERIHPSIHRHERGVNFCEAEGEEDYVKTSQESGLNMFISVHNILNIPNFPPKSQFNECLERLKRGVPLRSLLGCPDPTKIQYIQDPETGETKAKMTEEQAADARHIRQLDEKRKDRERRERGQREGDLALDLSSNSNTPSDNIIPLYDNSNTPCDYSLPLSKKNLDSALKTLGLTQEELRLISTRDLNILTKSKGLRRELIMEVKEQRRRLKNNWFASVREIDDRDEEAIDEARVDQAAGLAQGRARDTAYYSVESSLHEVSALRGWIEAANQQSSALSREDN